MRYIFFFFQAEDGIRDRNVTGVQTCALPISRRAPSTTPEVFRELQSDHGPHARDLVRDGQHREGHVRFMCAADECGRGEAGAVAGSAGGNPGWNAEGDARRRRGVSVGCTRGLCPVAAMAYGFPKVIAALAYGRAPWRRSTSAMRSSSAAHAAALTSAPASSNASRTAG